MEKTLNDFLPILRVLGYTATTAHNGVGNGVSIRMWDKPYDQITRFHLPDYSFRTVGEVRYFLMRYHGMEE